MYILALETATLPASFALAWQDELLVHVRQSPDDRAAETLLAQLHDSLRRLQIAPRQLDVVGLTVGPGSFTGLRCGVAIAKILGYSVGCRLVALGTMQVIASGVEPAEGTVRVVMDAQRSGLYWQRFHLRAGQPPEALEEVQMDPVIAVQRQLSRDERIVGPGVARLADGPAKVVRVLSEAEPRADLVAALTRQSAMIGQFVDPWTLVPSYVGRSAAENQLAAGRSRETER